MKTVKTKDFETYAGQAAAPLPAHETVYRQIRKMILFGELAPGQAVTIQGLTGKLSAGMTPVREAIRRLTAEGALVFQDNRRVSLPALSLGELEEISFARQAIEPRIAYLATNRITANDIHKLREIDDHLNTAIDQGDVSAYLKFNCQFHETLYAASQAGILLQISRALWLRVGPSLRVVCGRYGTANLPDKHDEALEGLKNRDAQAVAAAISADIQQGHDQIRTSLLDGENQNDD